MQQIKVPLPAGAPEAGQQPHLVQQFFRFFHWPASVLQQQPAPDSAEIIWRDTLLLLETQIPPSVYVLHFSGSQGVDVAQGRLLICLQSANSIGWVEARLMPAVRRALRSAGYDLEPAFTVWREQDND